MMIVRRLHRLTQMDAREDGIFHKKRVKILHGRVGDSKRSDYMRLFAMQSFQVI